MQRPALTECVQLRLNACTPEVSAENPNPGCFVASRVCASAEGQSIFIAPELKLARLGTFRYLRSGCDVVVLYAGEALLPVQSWARGE